MKKRILCAAVCLMLIIAVIIPALPAYAEYDAAAVFVTEALTGEAIAEQNADAPLFPAALVKLMSFLLFFEALESGRASESDMVSISPNAASKGGTSVFLDAGTQYPFSDLLQAAIVSSGNDATVALAEHIAGTETAFTELMNRRAAELGLTGHFSDPMGLDNTTAVSARELGRIAAELARQSKFFSYSTVWTYTFNHQSGRQTELTSSNKLVKTEGYDGMVTGSSRDAGYCLAASLKGGKTRFIAIILGSQSSEKRFDTAREVLGGIAAGYSVYEAARQGAKIKSHPIAGARQETVDICAANDLVLLVKKEQEQGITKNLEIGELSAPLKNGDVVGSMTVTIPDGEKHSIDLIVCEDIEASSLISGIKRLSHMWLFGSAG